MSYKGQIGLGILISCFLLTAFTPEKNALNECTPSKHTIDNYEPEQFPKSNNLLYAHGREQNIEGKKIVLRGILVDTHCIPIPDAKIQIWQTDNNGIFPYKFLRTTAAAYKTKKPYTSSFLGAGTAITDNEGKFLFITILPESKTHPYINIRVSHSLTGIFQTRYALKNNEQFIHDEAFSQEQDNNSYPDFPALYVKLVSEISHPNKKY